VFVQNLVKHVHGTTVIYVMTECVQSVQITDRLIVQLAIPIQHKLEVNVLATKASVEAM
jgi:hypothetical protein